MVYLVLTSDDGSADLDIRQKKRSGVRVFVYRIDEKKTQPDSRHDRYAESGSCSVTKDGLMNS